MRVGSAGTITNSSVQLSFPVDEGVDFGNRDTHDLCGVNATQRNAGEAGWGPGGGGLVRMALTRTPTVMWSGNPSGALKRPDTDPTRYENMWGGVTALGGMEGYGPT